MLLSVFWGSFKVADSECVGIVAEACRGFSAEGGGRKRARY